MIETTLDAVTAGDGALIEDLTRRAEAATPPQPYDVRMNGPLVVRTRRHDERIDVTNLEEFLPEPTRNRGAVVLYDVGDFAAYVQRLADDHTTVWGEESRSRFTAVFNDHADYNRPGWRDHSAELRLLDDPEWQAWLATDGRWFNQFDFAEFLEDRAATIVDPDPADFLEVASSFKAHKKAEFSSAVNLTTTDLQLTYNEETKTTTKSGQIEVPRRFTVALSPFLGLPPVNIPARLRYSVSDGQLSIGYRLHRPDLARRNAFADIRQTLANELAATDGDFVVPVMLGQAPGSLRP
ncbi:DUF2303 family protein [Prauserella muralis]|uniref:Uncharacterized protein n=1 Tax=Prauserella muralis TaxID=588067 RepID=A0A2V4AZW1_9PSEU|nr:DUF2303 family protein [Prauserella muralis]PXY27412.1 hypothetical protein BAY60_13335 [Prauserella muralis]TWE22890.1 uncharacterized protein YfdQ (DUF2303 family) [Prauserella muralis]